MRVLVACEESQAVTKELRELGHEAYSCDLQECSGGHDEWHLNVDASQLLKMKWDLIIAHPPCTYLTNGGAVRMYKEKGVIDEERYSKAMDAKDFFMLFFNSKCKHIAIENPVPMSCVGLPPYSQVIEPYEFGEPYSKKTCLWLKNLPLLKPTEYVEEYQPFINGGGGGWKDRTTTQRSLQTEAKHGARHSKELPMQWQHSGSKPYAKTTKTQSRTSCSRRTN